MSDPDVSAVRRRILSDHEETVRAVVAAADGVAAGWDGRATADRTAVVDPLERALRGQGLPGRLVDLLVDGVRATGREPAAEPVPAPPYLAVTGRGPVLRAPVDDGRIVVVLAVFTVVGNGGARYRRGGSDPGEVVRVEFHRD